VSEIEVRFHRLAAQEYRQSRVWYERRREGLGLEFREEVDRAMERIVAHPERWPVFRDRFRRVRLRRFPYALYYHVVDTSNILILALAHHRRRPAYWIRRVRKS
jgi:toxin ParE1/3/4